MRERCLACNGKGYTTSKKTCQACKGMGTLKLAIGVGAQPGKEQDCPECKGRGHIIERNTCLVCDEGFIYYCELCGKKLPNGKTNLCEDCDEDPYVIQLKDPVDEKYLKGNHALLGQVEEISKEGRVKIRLTSKIHGELKRGNKKQIQNLRPGQEVYVRILNPNGRSPFDLYLVFFPHDKKPRVVSKRRELKPIPVSAILHRPRIGSFVHIRGLVTEVIQTSTGPTQFTITDENGNSIMTIAFVGAGKRAYPEIDEGDAVGVYGYVNMHRDKLQIDSTDMQLLPEKEAADVKRSVEAALMSKYKVKEDHEFSVSSEAYTNLKAEFIKAAERIRQATLTSGRIFIRYHAPCVDGLAGALSLIHSIEGLYREQGKTLDEIRRLFRRYAQKSPYYDLADAIRDVSVALDEKERFGLDLPLIIIIDLGSSKENFASYKLLTEGYGLDVIVIDHHIPDQNIPQETFAFINPMTNDDELLRYAISGGMLSYELARMVNPKSDLDKFPHLPAISGIADRVQGTELDAYLSKASENGFDAETLRNTARVLDYLLFYNRYADAITMFSEIAQLREDALAQKNVAELLLQSALDEVDRSLEAAKANASIEEKEDFILVQLDLDKYSSWHIYPSNGKLIGLLHDSIVQENNKPVLTLGLGNDYLIYRGDKIDLNFTEIVSKLLSQFQQATIDGGGHLRAGSMRFLPGYKEKIVNELVNLVSTAVKQQA